MNISLKPTPFNNIKNLTKTIEVRLYRGPFTSINNNDIVIFHSSNGHIAKKIKDTKIFDSFENLFDELNNLGNINLVTPHISTREDFINHYKYIYKHVDINKFKVIAFFI